MTDSSDLMTLSEQPQPCLNAVTTFRLGGPCRRIIHCQTEGAASAALAEVNRREDPYVWMGGGSNILVSDLGIDAVVLRFETDEMPFGLNEGGLECCAAVGLDRAVAWLADQGWSGLNFCSGIPGTLGGGIVGNAGAWGQQIGDGLEWVDVLHPDGSVERVSAGELGFTYRHSRLKDQAGLVVRSRIRVEPAERADLLRERADILNTRSEKHPDLAVEPCIGSFFRNIEPSSAAEKRQAAGWFLEQAGAQGMTVGGARVFDRHANIIVADNGCRASDVHALSQQMSDAVFNQFGFRLTREIRLLGEFPGEKTPSGGFFH